MPVAEIKIISIREGGCVAHLCSNFRVWIEVQEASGKFRSCRVIVRFREWADRAAESDLQMRRLHLAVREVGGEFQTPADVLWLLLGNTPLFQFYRHSEKILASQGDGVTPLPM